MHPLLVDRPSNPGMCPDRESNRRPFALQNNAQSNEPQQSRPDSLWTHLLIYSNPAVPGIGLINTYGAIDNRLRMIYLICNLLIVLGNLRAREMKPQMLGKTANIREI